MFTSITVQGRHLDQNDIIYIQNLISNNPDDSRRRLSIKLCEEWDWRNHKGVLKDMACRSMMLKLDKLEHIKLPARRQKPNNRMAAKKNPMGSTR